MRRLRRVSIDWFGLQRAFERFDPSWEREPLPYLNVRTGQVAYFGAEEGMDVADTLDFERHVALSVSQQSLSERHARMRAFAAAIAEPDLSARLREVLSGEGCVNGFYRVLEGHPPLLSRWRRVEAPRVRELITDWLRSEALQPENAPPWE
jgi:hypothetical protein